MDGWCGTPSSFPFQGLPFLMLREGKALASGPAMVCLVLRHRTLPCYISRTWVFRAGSNGLATAAIFSPHKAFLPSTFCPPMSAFQELKEYVLGWASSTEMVVLIINLLQTWQEDLIIFFPAVVLRKISPLRLLCALGRNFLLVNCLPPSNTGFRRRIFFQRKGPELGMEKWHFSSSPLSFLQSY